MNKIKISLYIILLFNCINLNAEESNAGLFVQDIIIIGNSITKESIIIRELNFQKNDTILIKNLDEIVKTNKDNLLKTSLFNYVYITINESGMNRAIIIVEVEERWYLWPELYFAHADRNLSNWIKNMDLSRIKYGGGVSHYNFRGRHEKISVRFITGFVNEFAFIYNNLHLSKDLNHTLSFEFYYDTPNKMVYNVKDNKEEVLKFTEPLMTRRETYLQYKYRENIDWTHTIRAGLHFFNISDTIYSLNPEILNTNNKKVDYYSASYQLVFDKRDSKYYPLSGFHISGKIKVIDFFNDSYSNINFISSCSYSKQLGNKPLFSRSKLTFKYNFSERRPLHDYDELGYSSNLRGYEYYVVNGKYASIFSNSVRYQFLPTYVHEFKRVPVKSIRKVHFTPYLIAFADMAYVGSDNYFNNQKGKLTDTYLWSSGLGIEIATYYDKVLSLYIAHNSLSETGIFFSVLSGI